MVPEVRQPDAAGQPSGRERSGRGTSSGPPPADEPATERPLPNLRHATSPGLAVRANDLEPYVGLRYLAKLFRFMALVIALLLLAELVTGFRQQGTAAIATLIAEASRLLVLAGLLYGAGDLVMLLIDIGHDVRATRILLGRETAHHRPPFASDERRAPGA
jgi:hypothetical protein